MISTYQDLLRIKNIVQYQQLHASKIMIYVSGAVLASRLLLDLAYASFLYIKVFTKPVTILGPFLLNVSHDGDLHLLIVFFCVSVILNGLHNRASKAKDLSEGSKRDYGVAETVVTLVAQTLAKIWVIPYVIILLFAVLVAGIFALRTIAYIAACLNFDMFAESCIRMTWLGENPISTLASRSKFSSLYPNQEIPNRTRIVSQIYGPKSAQMARLQEAIGDFYQKNNNMAKARQYYLNSIDTSQGLPDERQRKRVEGKFNDLIGPSNEPLSTMRPKEE
jgi:hypothetical protein